MRTADFDFDLPSRLIAQTPAAVRDQSRLFVLHRGSGHIEHQRFRGLLRYLRRGDVLVLNNSRVIPARLRAVNAGTGGRFEILLLEENATNDWWAMLRPGKRARVGTQILFSAPRGKAEAVLAVVVEKNKEGHGRLHFAGTPNITGELEFLGEVPLPPYINRRQTNPGAPGQRQQDRERYQTVFARPPGSVAAPTAGLHFTESFLDEIRAHGVMVCFLTLHVGLGTFAPVKVENLLAHPMHEERYAVSDETARAINEAKNAGRRVVAVGTTTVRVLETIAAGHRGKLVGHAGKTRIFIYPPYDFKIVDALLTNFHLPRSTLLMLVSAFAAPKSTSGPDLLLTAYAEAIRERYRFFSYGDAMLLD